MILFVAVNLLLTIYRLLNRKWREGLENADDKCGPGSNCFPDAESGSDYGNTFREWQEKNAAAAATAKKKAAEAIAEAAAKKKAAEAAAAAATAAAAAAATAAGAKKKAAEEAAAAAAAAAAVAKKKAADAAAEAKKKAAEAKKKAAEAPAAQAAQAPAVKAMICPNGCTAPTELTGNCNSLEKDANGNYYKNCPYECTGDGCQYDQQCSNCGAFKITGLWDKNGNYIGQDESVHKTAASTVADGTRTVGIPDGTLDADTAAAYSQAGGSISTPSAVKTATCDVLAIHNNYAHSSTYGQWFPGHISKLNLSQTNYEHAGRKFLNEESVKKGIRTPLVMDSEAEVLGRLLWRVHLAAITQKCMKNIPTSVTTTMNDELALMKKVHQIQNSRTESSISGTACAINTSTQPIQTANCPTTGMMTDNRPSAYASSADATNSINSTVPSVSGASTAYSTDYHPRNPNKKPKPYNSIWDIF